MATTYTTEIQQLYVAYFSRPADPAGLAYWETVVEANGGSTAAVSAEFAASSEYTSAYADMTNAEIVNAVYNNLFGRDAETAGQTYWADLLTSGAITIDGVVTAIAAGAQTTDKVAYDDKVIAATAFTAAVDTDAEKAGYTGADANAAAKTFLAGVTDTTSLTAALDPATLATTVAGVVAAGTTFSVAGALAALDDANGAITTFLAGIDTDGDSTTDTTTDDIATAVTDAQTAVAGDLTNADGTSNAAAVTLFTADTSTAAIRDALINSQEAINAANLAAAQKTLTADNTAIAKISGLTAAVTTQAAATSALTATMKSVLSADAALAAQQASFQVSNSGTLHIDGVTTDGVTVDHVYLTTDDGDIDLGTISAAGKVTVSSSDDVSDLTGLSALVAAYNADATAVAAETKAQTTLDTANLTLNLLDVSTSATTVGDTGLTESGLIAALRTQINATTAGTVAATATPTVAQIQTEMAILKAAATVSGDTTTYDSFKALVDAETAATDFNPLVQKQVADTAAVKTVTDTIADLAKDVAALTAANGNASTLSGLQATVDADTALLTTNGYAVVTLDADHSGALTQFGTASSDVFVVDGQSATIAAFGLQGTDSLFVGTGYTLVNGAIGATGTTHSDTAMEIFLSSDDLGNAVLQIETHAYSSSVASTDGEIVTITLTGVDASTLHLGTDGIISTTAAATTA